VSSSTLVLAFLGGLAVGVVVGVVVSNALTGRRLVAAAGDAARRAEVELAERRRIEDAERRQEAAAELARRHEQIEASLARLGQTLQRLEVARSEDQAALAARVDSLASVTTELASTFRSAPSRGAWGEFHLRRVVEMAGMERWCDFTEQASLGTADARLRPDLVVHLPGGRNVVIDAKAPLGVIAPDPEPSDGSAGEGRPPSAVAPDDEGDLVGSVRRPRAVAGTRNPAGVARAVRQRVRELADRRYWEALEGTPDFVVLFLPFEASLAEALDTDPTLLDEAAAQKVVLATPTTLLALLKAVAYGWRQETLAREAALVTREASELYRRLQIVLGHLATLGTHLGRSVESYNKLVGSVDSRLVPAARQLHARGIGADEVEDATPLTTTTRPLRSSGTPDTENLADAQIDPGVGRLPRTDADPDLRVDDSV